jgi:hypothetical protein
MGSRNPEFTFWPVRTGVSRYHNCCIDGSASPEYFGYQPRIRADVPNCMVNAWWENLPNN